MAAVAATSNSIFHGDKARTGPLRQEAKNQLELFFVGFSEI
jgi:hypothetical protein